MTKEILDENIKDIIGEYHTINFRLLRERGIYDDTFYKFYRSIYDIFDIYNLKANSHQTSFINWLEVKIKKKILREITFDTLKNPKTGKYLHFDGLIKDTNILIEYDDESHFVESAIFNSSLAERQFLDQFKDNWAKENSFILIRFSYDDHWTDSLKRLCSILNISVPPSKKIFNSSYFGVSKCRNGEFSARVTLEACKSKTLFYSQDELLTALYREGWLFCHPENKSKKNNLDENLLLKYRVSSWEHYEDLRDFKIEGYWGVRQKGNKYESSYIVDSNSIYLGSFENELLAALYREAYIIVNNLPNRKNHFTKGTLFEYGFSSWEEVLKIEL